MSASGPQATRIDVFYFDDCPHAAAARALVRRCLARLATPVALVEHEGDHPSPTVRVDGVDVVAEVSITGRACRLDLPTETQVMEALGHAGAR